MGNIKIKKGLFDTKLELEHAGIKAGFPSPADDYIHDTLDFNRDYIRHPEASFYGDVEGDSMKDAGIFDGDRVIIDKAVEPHHGSIVVAFWNGEFTMKYLDLTTSDMKTAIRVNRMAEILMIALLLAESIIFHFNFYSFSFF